MEGEIAMENDQSIVHAYLISQNRYDYWKRRKYL